MIKTLKDIARELGVSPATVSRVVNRKGNVNKKTQKRIEGYLRENKYTPNQVARSLKVSVTKTIGIIMPDICEVFFGYIIKGIDSVVSKAGYSIILADSNENKLIEQRYLDLLFNQRVDALVVATVDLAGDKVMDFINSGTPIVFIDNLPSLSVPFDSVLTDNIAASRQAINHLLSKGHRDIAVIIGSPDETTGYDRLVGYRLALEEAGVALDNDLVVFGDYKEESGFRCMESLLHSRNRHFFSAVYVTSELMTFGAVKAIMRSGMNIPNDLAVIGFDVHDRTGLATPGITTIRQHEQKMGILVGDLLLKRLKEKQNGTLDSPRQKHLLPAYLEIKESCGGYSTSGK